MSPVGPRPPLPDEVSMYERWQRRRLSMKSASPACGRFRVVPTWVSSTAGSPSTWPTSTSGPCGSTSRSCSRPCLRCCWRGGRRKGAGHRFDDLSPSRSITRGVIQRLGTGLVVSPSHITLLPSSLQRQPDLAAGGRATQYQPRGEAIDLQSGAGHLSKEHASRSPNSAAMSRPTAGSASIRPCLDEAVARGHLKGNPASGIKRLRENPAAAAHPRRRRTRQAHRGRGRAS